MPIEPIILRTLGTAQVDIGRIQVRPNAVRRFSVLLYLSAEPGRRASRRCLIDLLFPEQTEKNGLHSLRELLYQLKSAGVALDADQEGIELPVGAVRADYAEMLDSERLTLEQIRAAQGGFLPGYAPHDSEAYTEWFEPFRARTAFALSQVLLRAQARAQDVGNLEVSEAAARACLAISPLNERAVRGLAETMALGGAKMDALRLLDEYGAEVGALSSDLKLSADLLRKTIREKLPDDYRPSSELPFVGRDAEMLGLRRQFDSSRAGLARVAVVVGEAGIGKTRLVSEFASIVTLEKTSIVRVGAQPFDHARPMGIFVDIVPKLLELPGALGVSPRSMEALHRLTSSAASAFKTDSDPEIVSRAITDAIEDLIGAISGESHLTIIVEDAHWADPVSLRVIAELSGQSSRPLFFLLTSREPELRDLCEKAPEDTAFIRLLPLDHAVAQDLARRALRNTKGEAFTELHSWMAEVSNGQPLFVSTLVAHFAVTGAAFTVPASLQELILKRLDSLDAASTVVLQTCVLLGALATLDRTLTALELPFIDAVAAVAKLDALRLLRFVDRKQLQCHAVVGEALLRRSPEVVLRMLHLRIATLLERELAAAESPTVLWNCAEHWSLAGEHLRAVALIRRCADHANDIGRPAAAAEILLNAAKLQLNDSLRLDLLRDAVRSARRAREHDVILEGVAAIRCLDATIAHDDIEIAELSSLSVAFVDSPDFEKRALACLLSAEANPEHRVRVAVASLMYADTYSRPDLARAVATALHASDVATVDELLQLEYKILHQIAFGEPAAAAPHARRMQQCGAALQPASAAVVELNVANVYWRAGMVEHALRANQHAYGVARDSGAISPQLRAALHASDFHIDLGNYEEAKAWHATAQAIQRAHTREVGEFETAAERVLIAAATGDTSGAAEALGAADQQRVFSTPIRRRWRRYFDARIRQLAGGPALNADEITAFRNDWSDASSTSGIRENETLVLLTAFRTEGGSSEARQLLVDFLAWRQRYSLAPIPYELRSEIARSGLSVCLEEWDLRRVAKINQAVELCEHGSTGGLPATLD